MAAAATAKACCGASWTKGRKSLPLVLSVDGGHLEAARLLLVRGAAPDELNGEALRLATRFGRHDIAELLLQRGAAPVQGPPATLPSGDAGQNPGNKENELPLAWERSV